MTDRVPWWQRRMVGLDLETTSPLPEQARIVTASLAVVGGALPTRAFDWIADPGVEVPDEAAAVHGFTTERVRAEGAPVGEVVADLLDHLARYLSAGMALVVFNARYDLTVLDRECRRLGLPSLTAGPAPLQAVDPSVVDKRLDRYRRSYPRGMTPEAAAEAGVPSSRTLAGMCAVYGATLEQAHESGADAIAAARLAYAMGKRGEVVRRVRNATEGRELAALRREWEAVRHDLPALHAAQARWALEERARFAEYKRSVGDVEDADRIDAERGWPVLELMAHELDGTPAGAP